MASGILRAVSLGVLGNGGSGFAFEGGELGLGAPDHRAAANAGGEQFAMAAQAEFGGGKFGALPSGGGIGSGGRGGGERSLRGVEVLSGDFSGVEIGALRGEVGLRGFLPRGGEVGDQTHDFPGAFLRIDFRDDASSEKALPVRGAPLCAIERSLQPGDAGDGIGRGGSVEQESRLEIHRLAGSAARKIVRGACGGEQGDRDGSCGDAAHGGSWNLPINERRVCSRDAVPFQPFRASGKHGDCSIGKK